MRVFAAILALVLPAAAAAGEDPHVTVKETSKGTYTVSARFTVMAPASVAYDVLTDYAEIPRVIPNIKQSRVVERSGSRAVVEQVAVSRFALFSKRVQLTLHIDEASETIRFRDALGASFTQYEGSWTLTPQGDGVELQYELTARPTFDVHPFIVRKVLNGDAREMAERLRAEMVARTIRKNVLRN